MTLVDPAEYTRKVFAWAEQAGLKQVRLVIHQPKLGGPTEDVVPMDDLEAFARELHLKADRVRVADVMHAKMAFEDWWPIYLNPEPSREACEYCRAMPTCPSMQAKLQRDALVDFGAVTEDEPPKPPTTVLDLNQAMKIIPLMEDWCKATRAEMERQMMAGAEFPDFGLELGRQGNRRWADPTAAEEFLRQKVRLRIEEAYGLKLRTPTQIEKMTKGDKDETGKPMKARISERQWSRVEKFITRDEPTPSVKPKAAIKVAWTPKPVDASAFTPVPEDGDDLS